ncbi:MAG TPA: DUF1206 domain-containing protein [Gemmatimonadales bacterium]|nr:DUF1206 domain-containing protein [Gemmatimonadales bacterium]
MTAPTVHQVAPWVERLARIGYAAKGILYITVGLLAAQAGLGRGGRTVDTQGALRVVHTITFGRIALLVIAAGLMGYAIWRIVEAVVDPDGRGTDAKGLALRASFAARGVLYGALGITALRLAARERPGSHSEQTRHWTELAFGLPAGELLVWLAASGIGGYGIYQLYRAYASKLSRQLHLGELGTGTLRWIVGVSRFGIAARGVVFCLIGFFLAGAAARHDATQAGGLRKSMGVLAGIGLWPIVVVALGLVAYGVYELVNARYRRISVG